jgi:RND family efflux transporter MFP subunit
MSRPATKPLAEKKAIADADYQRLLTEVIAREAEVAANTARRDLAQKMLDDCVIRTPFAGVVAERMVEAGEYVGPGAPVARVVESGTLRLVLNVPETEVAALVVGQKIEFTTAAYSKRLFTGKLQHIGAAMREVSRDLVVEALVDNADLTLRPGFFCDARILLREEKAVAVPEGALRIEGSRRKVFVITKDNTISERLVEVARDARGLHRNPAWSRRSVKPLLAKPSARGRPMALRFEPTPLNFHLHTHHAMARRYLRPPPGLRQRASSSIFVVVGVLGYTTAAGGSVSKD